MWPPAPNPVSGLSAANDASTAQTAASTALPPSRRASAPASAVSGWPAATTPLTGRRPLAGEKLGDVERAELAGLLDPRRAAPASVLGAADHRLGRAPRCRRLAVEAGRHHGHPDLVA